MLAWLRETVVWLTALSSAVIFCMFSALIWPPDSFYKDMFALHRADFTRLTEMLRHDSQLTRVGLNLCGRFNRFSGQWQEDASGGRKYSTDQVLASAGVSIDRLTEYENLCSRLGLRSASHEVLPPVDSTDFWFEDGMGRDFWCSHMPHMISEGWLGPRVELHYNSNAVEKSSAPPGWSLNYLSGNRFEKLN